MIRYFVECNQNGNVYKTELHKRNKNIWYKSNKYLGSSTRAFTPELYTYEKSNIIYKSFEFILKKITDNFCEEIIYNKIVTDEYIKLELDRIKNNILEFNPILNSIKINMENIGEINFGIRDLHRWPGNPGEIYNCILKLK